MAVGNAEAALKWWKMQWVEGAYDFNASIHYEPYQLTLWALQHHPDQRVAHYFRDVYPFHFRFVRNAFWRTNSGRGPRFRATRAAINEAILGYVESRRSQKAHSGGFFNPVSGIQNLTLLDCSKLKLRSGRNLGTDIFRANSDFGFRPLMKDALERSKDAEIRAFAERDYRLRHL